ncbi:LOW QUALITY PROTEIN: receptor-type tyrosine-protein phosphatase O-like [Sinocyclocheilus grahami]|uniref:LOW QUALITY PROTEIN: receptor-type tyrosine-protein phosphatase O-like n=1 Tax=Sinocyclocheilus grahami TaxID=75366 RepID=UPI0007ACF578|nr:PREDICTED: LOW QUALITY PROTEIN: receptor-type tyrosine-protein phosphatase O-like [Sinocyclocheilus grahami]
MSSALRWVLSLCFIITIIIIQRGAPFQVALQDDHRMLLSLDADDVRPEASVYSVRVSGEPHTHTLLFTRPADGQTLPHPLQFNASYHGLCYSISLMLGNDSSASRAVRTVPVLTKPLPLDSIEMSDYSPAPETGVMFQIRSPDRNIYTRVNISYMEGRQPRYMLYKDFLKGKTVFKHWLSGTCYTNISFQLVSEATVNRSTLVSHSDVTHEPLRHRTVPNPPLNVSLKIIHLSGRGASHNASVFRRARDVPAAEEQEEEVNGVEMSVTQTPLNNVTVYSTTAEPNSTELLWAEPTGSPAPTEEQEEEFVNALVPEYEDSNEPGSAMDVTFEPSVMPKPLPPILLELRWLPPRPPAAYDGFNIYIHRDGNSTETATVDENTHEFFTELSEAGTYGVHVTTLSSSGDCEARESSADTGFTFYLSPAGEWMEQPQERPQEVSVKMLDSSTAAVSWAPSRHRYNGSLISVLSLTCLRPSISQRMENTYCSEENITSDIISSLTPGAQYRVMVYHTNGPLVSPPSEPVIIDIEPTGVHDLVVYPLSPSAAILSWQRPYNVAFRKYVLQTFFFNSATQTSQWTTYYEIAATASVIASVRVTDLLPAWFYNFRVTMVTWGDPPLSCCDASTVSFVTAPEAPHISSVDYAHGTLFVRWTYGDLFTDLSHSRMLHWQLTAEGKKGARRRYSIDVTRNMMKASLTLPPGDIYNLTVSACTERNGVVDFYQIVCRPLRVNRESKKVREPLLTAAHVVTVSGLQPSTSYNCTVISSSYSSVSDPAYITVSTTVREMNPSVAAISALAVLSVLLIILLVLFLLVLRKKHMELSRECGAETFVNFASFERDGKLPYNWRRSLFAFLTLLPSCLWTDYLLAFYINPWSKTALKKRKLTSPVQLSDFDAYIKDMSKDSAYKFSLQFEELKSVGLDLSHEAADLPVNRPKNRYTNILPYDFSRVKLISLHNDEGSDYINANFIPGYNSPHEFIATQGPLPETRNDFWKMVLQQKSHIVVMLTQCNERRRCFWLLQADETQDVLHFNYTSWPDHGVPTVNAIESILHFVQIVRQQVNRTKGPIVVHCSAGVGRTGTFIALDRLMQHIQEHEYVDVLGLVSDMRSHRLSMVQTEEQYVFIHQCVLLMWKKKKQQTHTSDVIYENVSKS